MALSDVINQIFRQNFKNHRVLGRVLFGVSMMFMGLLNLFNIKAFADFAPDYLPAATLLVILVGIVLTLAGFGLFANLYVTRSAQTIILLFIAFILIVHLPQSDILELAKNVAYISAALLIWHNVERGDAQDPSLKKG